MSHPVDISVALSEGSGVFLSHNSEGVWVGEANVSFQKDSQALGLGLCWEKQLAHCHPQAPGSSYGLWAQDLQMFL